jgi:hypothetical protein
LGDAGVTRFETDEDRTGTVYPAGLDAGTPRPVAAPNAARRHSRSFIDRHAPHAFPESRGNNREFSL